MFCKYCKAELKEGNRYCSYCGKKVEEESPKSTIEKESTYNDPFKDYRIENNSHQDQFTYQNQYSGNIPYRDSNTQNKIQYKEPSYNPNNNSILAIIFIGLGIMSLFYMPLLSILFGILALVFGITGRNHTSKAFGNFVLVISIIGFIFNLILGPLVFVFNLDMTIANQQTTLFNYFRSMIDNTMNIDNLSGEFYTQEGHLFVLDNYYGTYYYYSDASNTRTLYFTGDYEIIEGVTINGDDLYADDNYYYYTFIPTNAYYVDEEGKNEEDTLVFTRWMTIKLSRKDKNKIIISDKGTDTELNKEKKNTNSSLPTT